MKPATHRLVQLSIACALACLALAPRAALACSVCSFGRDDETRTAFIATTALLSILPLALVGGFVWWLRRRSRQVAAQAAPARDLAA